MVIIFAAGLFIISATLHAADVPFEFNTVEQEQRYKELAEQLRCLVCQNQSLADSHAELAQDLRNEVYRMILEGQSDQQIVEFLVARYGDYVMFRPPLKSSTIALWIGPFLLLLIALMMVVRFTLKNKRQMTAKLSSDDQNKLDTLLRQNGDQRQV